MLWRIAWRNLWRNRRRSIIILGSLVVATVAMILQDSLYRGLAFQMPRNQIGLHVGHVQIYRSGYHEDPLVELSIDRPSEIAHFAKGEAGPAFTRAILGLDYQFNPKLYGLLEYHFNGEGKRERAQYEFARLFRGEILNVFLQTVLQLHPLVRFGVGSCLNLDDGSRFVLTNLSYSAADNAALSAGLQACSGAGDAEYGSYPSAGFLRFEWYF
jgi:hypothetical protein